MKTVIEVAIEVGISDLTIGLYQQELERLVELVRADEREACAKVCEENAHNYLVDKAWCAEAIRARSNT